MLVIRPIAAQDFSSLKAVAIESGIGFTSLPDNDTLLENKIHRATHSFTKVVAHPEDEGYLFVLEDTDTSTVVGTCGIESSVGVDDAFYNYHVGKVVHSSRELNIHNTVEILTFCNDYTGMSEICTLFLREQARLPNVGKFLSKSRFLFIAEHKERFTDKIFAEMRGVSDENGRSPFWDWLEKHFFSLDFPTADYLTGIGNKVFIAELMPKYPIYVNLLSEAAQAVIGAVHEKTKPALALLEKEGFKNRGYVDIFDAGPAVEADIDQIKTIRESTRKPAIAGAVPEDNLHIIINTEVADFRAVCQPIRITDDHIIMSQQAMETLHIKNGDIVRVSPV
ncbi:arginine N-succinyltransferase [Opacimonas viscosa]|uniref:Arginine N-succinyltransferase n=1 Tax=Opacimonas viscosa TaxID=2961944 RepID=A0AA41X4E1_9ALTE|nr:arginine N-succinyltransferase [Opacimonas viscosa]MCP3429276.1 arginine N-succinyltransferase [Opacimonas viscosa]